METQHYSIKPVNSTATCTKCGGSLENHLDYIHCVKCGMYWEPIDDPIDEWGLEPEAWGGGFAKNN